jgi:hypothetical protein
VFVVSKREYFMENSELYDVKTINNNLFQPQSNLSVYQRGPHYACTKMYNNVPTQIKLLSSNFNPPDMEHISTYKYTSMYKLSILGKRCPIVTRINILSWAMSYSDKVSYNNVKFYNKMISYTNKVYYMYPAVVQQES